MGEERRQRKHMGEGTSEPGHLRPVRKVAWLGGGGILIGFGSRTRRGSDFPLSQSEREDVLLISSKA